MRNGTFNFLKEEGANWNYFLHVQDLKDKENEFFFPLHEISNI